MDNQFETVPPMESLVDQRYRELQEARQKGDAIAQEIKDTLTNVIDKEAADKIVLEELVSKMNESMDQVLAAMKAWLEAAPNTGESEKKE